MLGEIFQQPSQLRQPCAAPRRFPSAACVAPEKNRLTIRVPRLRNLVEDHQQMPIRGHHALAASLFAQARVKQFGNFPCPGKNWAHARSLQAIPNFPSSRERSKYRGLPLAPSTTKVPRFMEYEAVIGLETHVQLKTKSKMWCGCANEFGALPNTNVCPVCLGMPGVLPVANEEALKLTALTGILLNCEIARFAKFDRKNYFYPDAPKNYQVTQYDKPSTQNGWMEFEFGGG